MKEINPDKPLVNESEIVDLKKEKRQSRFIGRLVPQGGQKVWEYNNKEKTLKEAELTKKAVILSGETAKGLDVKNTNRKLIIKPQCIYVLAINKKNAEKKVVKKLRELINLSKKQS